ncbi:MAG: preprotein translocase subunit SecE [Desulfobacter sp.]|nr:MAG: preprotein translocase subunit SecE [Desulfobacter sp.]
MSKMQKKKPSVDKKKRKVGAEQDAAGRVAVAPSAKPAATGIASKAKAEKAVVEAGSGNLFTKAAEFLREVKVELKKVTWPTRKQTTGTTIVVILFVFVVAAFLGLFDFSLSRLVQVVLT